MQTFLPYSSFEQTAKCLDYKRLGKQRVEAKQILQCLLGEGSHRWANHPAVKMWKGYEKTLALYGYFMCKEWVNRGYKDFLGGWFWEKYISTPHTDNWCPPFMLNEYFLRSHQSNLIRKFPEHYRPIFGDNVPDNLPYIWK